MLVRGLRINYTIHLRESDLKLVHYGRDEYGAKETVEQIRLNGGAATTVGFDDKS